jgi:hypothetical protein
MVQNRILSINAYAKYTIISLIVWCRIGQHFLAMLFD